MNILKTVHLLSGVVALLLSFVPSLRGESLPWLQQPDALYLAFIGLANLLIAPLAGTTRQRRQLAASALTTLAVVLQGLTLLLPLETFGGQPAVLFALLAMAGAALLQLLPSLPAGTVTTASTPAASPSAAAERPLPPPARPAPTPTRAAAGRSQPAAGRETGTVKWFNTSKGFGFISRDCGEDIFVHFRAIRGEGHRVLVEGQRVEFAVVQRDKGLQAEDVAILDD